MTTGADPYSIILTAHARRNLHEHLATDVALAAMETISGPIAARPRQVGKPLNEPFDGCYSARRGTYRIIYSTNEDKHAVEILSVRRRRDAYRV